MRRDQAFVLSELHAQHSVSGPIQLVQLAAETLGCAQTTGQVLELLNQLLRDVPGGFGVISQGIDGTDQAGHRMGKGCGGGFDLVGLFAHNSHFSTSVTNPPARSTQPPLKASRHRLPCDANHNPRHQT